MSIICIFFLNPVKAAACLHNLLNICWITQTTINPAASHPTAHCGGSLLFIMPCSSYNLWYKLLKMPWLVGVTLVPMNMMKSITWESYRLQKRHHRAYSQYRVALEAHWSCLAGDITLSKPCRCCWPGWLWLPKGIKRKGSMQFGINMLMHWLLLEKQPPTRNLWLLLLWFEAVCG